MSASRRDSGFSLIEVLVTISLLVVLLAISIAGWSSWSKARQQSGTATELQSTLRQTQQRAVTEGTSMCVTFATTSYTVWRGACTGSTPSAATRVEGPVKAGSGVQIASADVPQGVTFTARGTSKGGVGDSTRSTLTVTRTGSPKVYTLQVEGFTGRVSLA
jgi:prepilin-type N-terminal cleavage/methylation domain-containing protein